MRTARIVQKQGPVTSRVVYVMKQLHHSNPMNAEMILIPHFAFCMQRLLEIFIGNVKVRVKNIILLFTFKFGPFNRRIRYSTWAQLRNSQLFHHEAMIT